LRIKCVSLQLRTREPIRMCGVCASQLFGQPRHATRTNPICRVRLSWPEVADSAGIRSLSKSYIQLSIHPSPPGALRGTGAGSPPSLGTRISNLR
jgi:hypothetical protein